MTAFMLPSYWMLKPGLFYTVAEAHIEKKNKISFVSFVTDTSGYCEIQGFTRRLFHIKAKEWNQILSYLRSYNIYKTPKTVGGTVGDADSNTKMRKSSVNRVNLQQPSRKRNQLIWASLSKCTDSAVFTAGNTTATLGQNQVLTTSCGHFQYFPGESRHTRVFLVGDRFALCGDSVLEGVHRVLDRLTVQTNLEWVDAGGHILS